MNSFDLLHAKVKKLAKTRFKNPTLVQQKAIPFLLQGKNALVIAETGVGKTESVFLPILSKLISFNHDPIALLYITPLRALNRDLLDRMIWWARHLNLEIAVRHGDTTQYERTKQSEFPPHILITTPETMQAILPGKRLREHLKNVKYVIVDEVHELAESKRGAQLSLGLERLRELAGDFQIIGLSATIGSPREVAKFLGGPAEVEIIQAMSPKELDIYVISPAPLKKDRRLAEEILLSPGSVARLREIKNLISNHRSTLVFTNTREAAEILSSRLRRIEKDFDHGTHHSSLSKDVRLQAEKKFKEEELKALIATSSLELGIDIGSVDLIVQYQSPRQVTRLVQRIGRSGHRVGAKSKGIIIATSPDDILEAAVITRRALAGHLEKTKFHLNALDVLLNQIIGLSLEKYGLETRKAYELIKKSWLYKELREEKFLSVLHFARDIGLVFIKDGIVKRKRAAWRYYYNNLSTIPDTKSWYVIDIASNQEVGQLDEGFVAEHGQVGTSFIVRGRPWRITGLGDSKVFVEPIESLESSVPAWEGELIPVPREVAEEVAELRKRIFLMLKKNKEEIVKEIKKNYKISRSACAKVISYICSQAKTKKIPADNENFVLESEKDFAVLHACCGTRINETISRWLAAKLSQKFGRAIAVRSDPYRIIIQGATPSSIVQILKKGGDLEEELNLYIDMTRLFKWRFLHVAKRFGAVERDVKWERINIKKLIQTLSQTPIWEETRREVWLEKLDVDGAAEILSKIRAGKIKIINYEGISPIGREGLEYQFRELVAPTKPEKEIFTAFKTRLLSTRVRLICARCGRYSLTRQVRDLPAEPACQVCHSRLLTVIKPWQHDFENLIKRKIQGKSIKQDEKKTLARLEHVAELVLTYGKKVIIALAGRGIGPETAIRILAKQHEGEEFLRDILVAEKEYIRTKRYWKI